jgi:WD40 repeat protein
MASHGGLRGTRGNVSSEVFKDAPRVHACWRWLEEGEANPTQRQHRYGAVEEALALDAKIEDFATFVRQLAVVHQKAVTEGWNLTQAEQNCDALAALWKDWGREPAKLDAVLWVAAAVADQTNPARALELIASAMGKKPDTPRKMVQAATEVLRTFRPTRPELWDPGRVGTRAGSDSGADAAPTAAPASGDAPVPVPARCPFPGLEFFNEKLADVFFGREQECSEALACIGGTHRWLQIEGASGAGKSSFTHAGIVPGVRRGEVEGAAAAWHVAVLRPGPDPLVNLAEAVFNTLGLDKFGELDVIRRALDESDTGLASILRERTPKGDAFLLVVDQLEEAFTLAPKGAESTRRFDARLARALSDTEGPLHLVTTIRSDFLGRFGELPELERQLNTRTARYHLKAISSIGLRDAIMKPAQHEGLTWDEGLADRILREAEMSSGGLPLVAHVLRELWDKRDSNKLTNAVYDMIGGISGALQRSADGVVKALPPDGTDRARKLLVRLVKTGRGAEDVRQTVTRRDAIEAAGSGEEAERVLVRLSGGREPGQPIGTRAPVRLVVVSGEEDEARVDLVHEALLKRWETLRSWVNESRKALERRDDLEDLARIWEKNGAPSDGLPGAVQLEILRSAEGYSARAGRFLDAAEVREGQRLRQEENARFRKEQARQEKKRARQELERQRARRQRNVIVGLTVGLLMLAIVAAFARKQQVEADQQRTQAEDARKRAEASGIQAEDAHKRTVRQARSLLSSVPNQPQIRAAIHTIALGETAPDLGPVDLQARLGLFTELPKLPSITRTLGDVGGDLIARGVGQFHVAAGSDVVAAGGPSSILVWRLSDGRKKRWDAPEKMGACPALFVTKTDSIVWGTEQTLVRSAEGLALTLPCKYHVAPFDDFPDRGWSLTDGGEPVAVSDDGLHIASVGPRGISISVPGVKSSDEVLPRSSELTPLKSAVFAPDGSLVVQGTIGDKNVVRAWLPNRSVKPCDVKSATIVGTLRKKQGQDLVEGVLLRHENGYTLLRECEEFQGDAGKIRRSWSSVRGDFVVEVRGRLSWYLPSGEVVDWLPSASDDWDEAPVALSASGAWLATVNSNGSVRVLYPPGVRARVSDAEVRVGVSTTTWLTWSGDGSRLASMHSSKKGRAAIIDPREVRLVDEVGASGLDVAVFLGATLVGLNESTRVLIDAASGREIEKNVLGIAACGSSHAFVFADRVVIGDTGEPARTLPAAKLPPELLVHTSTSADCGVVVVVTENRKIFVWDQDGKQREVGAGGRAAVDTLGRWIAVVDSGTLRVLDAHTLAQLWTTDRAGALVRGLAFDPRGRFLLVGDFEGGVSFWEPSHGVRLGDIPVSGLSALAVSPDGRSLAIGHPEGRVTLIDLGLLDEPAEELRQRAFCATGLRFANGDFEALRDISSCAKYIQ